MSDRDRQRVGWLLVGLLAAELALHLGELNGKSESYITIQPALRGNGAASVRLAKLTGNPLL